MKVNKTFGIILLIAVILGVSYLIYISNKKAKVVAAAVNSGIPADIAITAANSSNVARSLMSLGVSESAANLISSGVSASKELYKCTHTDGTVKDGPCSEVDANNNWTTSSK